MIENLIREYYIMIKNKLSEGRIDSAMSSADKLLMSFPRDENAFYYKGCCEFALLKFEEALKCFLVTVQLDVTHARGYFNLGICYFEFKKYDLALINVAKALVIFTRQRELDKKARCMEALRLIQRERDL